MAKKRQSKMFSMRKPRLNFTKKGLKVSGGGVRIGDKAGVNISNSGVSYSVRTKQGSYNSKSGCRAKLPCASILVTVFVLFILVIYSLN